MKSYRSTRNSGFTLVEILIVVIILGILAAIVIPQFTNASQDARKSSLTSQLQTLRSQVELYKLQHRDKYPTSDGLITAGDSTWDWNRLVSKTDEDGTISDTGAFGPYLQAAPENPIFTIGTDHTIVSIEATELSFGGGLTDPSGWAITPSGKIYAATKSGEKVYNEADPNAADNDL